MLNYNRTRHACYFSYLATSSIFVFPPMLFLTFHDMYGISYTLLGTLVLINFCTQLLIDLTFSFFSKYFNVKFCMRIMPLMTSLGMFLYAIIPWLFPDYAFVGLALGTVVFSVSAGFSEVLLSPTVAALPSKNHERDMSILHSLYAYGVLMVVIVSSAYLAIFGGENWMYLAMFWATLPIITFVMFCISPLPSFNKESSIDAPQKKRRNFGFILCIACIFMGAAAENAMTNWISGYMETVIELPKFFGDIIGLALFAVLLGVTRSLYAKYGKNIEKMLLFGMIGAVVCYLTAALCTVSAIAVIASFSMGLCTSMLWPGTLILMEENYPTGVGAYALMAAGGDLGSAVAPQLLGYIVDAVSASEFASELATSSAMSVEEIGMRAGMLCAAVFPLIGVAVVVAFMKRYSKRANPKLPLKEKDLSKI